jgi:hypothetical protein
VVGSPRYSGHKVGDHICIAIIVCIGKPHNRHSILYMQGTLVAKFQEMKRLPEDTDNLFKINRFLAASFPNQSHNNFTKFAHEEERYPERVRGTWECLQVAWPRRPRRLARAFAGPLSVLHGSGPSSKYSCMMSMQLYDVM